MDLGLRIACLQHVPYEGPGFISDWARARRHRVRIRRLDAGERLPMPEQFDWLVIMGGPMGLRDEARYPWMAGEKALIREAIPGDDRTAVVYELDAQDHQAPAHDATRSGHGSSA
jgi:GMP synthase-like glutamine amidotransferase